MSDDHAKGCVSLVLRTLKVTAVGRLAALAVLAAGISGCSVLPEQQPKNVYQLPASEISPGTGPAVDSVLRVARPLTDDLQGGTQIVVAPDAISLRGYQQSRWNTSTPELFRDHLMDAFRRDGRVAYLTTERDSIGADIRLGGYLRAFRVEYRQGTPYARLSFDAMLIDEANSRLLNSQRFEVSEPLAAEPVEAAVRALWRATETLSQEVIDWTIGQL